MRNKRKLFTLNCLARKIYSFDLLTSGKLFHFLLLIWLKNISWNHIEVDFWKGFVGFSCPGNCGGYWENIKINWNFGGSFWDLYGSGFARRNINFECDRTWNGVGLPLKSSQISILKHDFLEI